MFARHRLTLVYPLETKTEITEGCPRPLHPPPRCSKPHGGIPWLVKMEHGRLCGERPPDPGETIPGMPGSPAPRCTAVYLTKRAMGFGGYAVASALAATASASERLSHPPARSSRQRSHDSPAPCGIAHRFRARVPGQRIARPVRNWFYQRQEFSCHNFGSVKTQKQENEDDKVIRGGSTNNYP